MVRPVKLGAPTLALLVVALFAARSAHGSPADVFGFGPRSQALGGTGAALGRGFESTYANPALLSRCRRPEVAFGWQAARFSVHVDPPEHQAAIEQEGLAGTTLGLVVPLPFGGALADRVTLGLGAFSPSGKLVRARLYAPERPQLPLLSDHTQALNLALGLGLDLGRGWRLGGGALALAQLLGDVDVGTALDGRVSAAVEDQLVASYAPVVGVALELGGGFVTAAAWRGALSAEFDMQIRVLDLGGLVMPELNIAGVAQYDPMQLQAEIGRRWEHWEVSLGATYKRWSAFHGWEGATVHCRQDEPGCDALVPAPIAFSDTLVPRVGAEARLALSSDATGYARTGYFFEPSSLPAQTGEHNLWDHHRHALTLGYGVELEQPLALRLDLFYQLHWLVSRTHRKAQTVDRSNPGYPEVTTSGTIHASGLTATLRL
jgi:hypothetical protein